MPSESNRNELKSNRLIFPPKETHSIKNGIKKLNNFIISGWKAKDKGTLLSSSSLYFSFPFKVIVFFGESLLRKAIFLIVEISR